MYDAALVPHHDLRLVGVQHYRVDWCLHLEYLRATELWRGPVRHNIIVQKGCNVYGITYHSCLLDVEKDSGSKILP